MNEFYKWSSFCSLFKNKKRIVGLNFLHNTMIDYEINDLNEAIVIHKDNLIKNGFLYTRSDIDENYLLLNLIKKVQKINSVNSKINFTLVPTLSCNAMCRYCYEVQQDKKKTYFWEKDIINKIIKNIVVITKETTQNVSFDILGGEIFQNKFSNHITMLLESLRNLGFKKCIHIITNGIELPNFINLLNNNQDMIRSIQLTLDGPKKFHDKSRPNALNVSSFDSNMDSMSQILEHFYVDLRLHVKKDNLSVIPEVLDKVIMLKKKYGDKINPYIYPITIIGENADCAKTESIRDLEIDLLSNTLDIFKNIPENKSLDLIGIDFPGSASIWNLISRKRFKIRTYFCSANGDQYVFSPDGNVFKCWWAISKENCKVGDVDNGIDYKLNLYWKQRSLSDDLTQCINCKYALICAGGCSYKALLNNNNIYKPLCPNFDKIILKLLEYKYSYEGSMQRVI